ncbi:hypothetical protein GH733_004476 [Mirounga leonina]|nr:hypothetical protein GH733_004476 [Mirounga leonina]
MLTTSSFLRHSLEAFRGGAHAGLFLGSLWEPLLNSSSALSLSMATGSHTYEPCCVPRVVIQDGLGGPGLSAEPRTTTGGQ